MSSAEFICGTARNLPNMTNKEVPSGASFLLYISIGQKSIPAVYVAVPVYFSGGGFFKLLLTYHIILYSFIVRKLFVYGFYNCRYIKLSLLCRYIISLAFSFHFIKARHYNRCYFSVIQTLISFSPLFPQR